MSRWSHRLHALARRRRLATGAGGEVSVEERARIARWAATCDACRQEVEAYRLVSAALGSTPPAVLTAAEAATFRAGVQQRIDRGVRPAPRARRGLRELLADHPRTSLASALATVALVLGLTVMPLIGRDAGRPPRDGVEVLSIEVGENTSVMVFDVPDGSAKIVWLFEKSPS